ncbi:MAG: type II toxin-antitoxin system YafQ family toxin [Rickettsiales bacterium]|jgi:mRNA interferase YafQ|nr:type II toxin-antitoxin system YafQ family toxin [Rickettsiales bacterium]
MEVKLKLLQEKTFRKDIKKIENNKKARKTLNEVLAVLTNGQKLNAKYKEHKLVGDKKDYLECHVLPDLVLIYQITPTELKLNRICNHSELLKK